MKRKSKTQASKKTNTHANKATDEINTKSIYAIVNTGGNLNIRTGPSKQHPRLGVLYNDTKVIVLGRTEDNEWLLVQTISAVGWVMARYLRILDGSAEVPSVKHNELVKYLHPNLNAEIFLPVPESEIHKTPSRFEIAPVSQVLGRLSATPPSNIQDIAASQTALLINYYNLGLDQARRSFNWALTAAVVGFVFFSLSLFFAIDTDFQNASIISLISGALLEIISGINFYLYGKSTSQLAGFQDYLDRTQNILLANSICESLPSTYKNKTRAELVKIVASKRDQLDIPKK
jgi:hypothetical protein